MEASKPPSHFFSRRTMLKWRVTCVVFFFGYITWRVLLYGPMRYFYILTGWNFVFDLVYFFFGVLVLVRPASRFLGVVHRCLFSCVQTIGWIVCLVFWIFLSGKWNQLTSGWEKTDMFIGQIFNLLLPILDFVAGTTVVDWTHVWVPNVVFVAYCVFGLCLHLSNPVAWPWPYLFLDWINGPTGVNWPSMAALVAFFMFFTTSLHFILIYCCQLRDAKFGPRDPWDQSTLSRTNRIDLDVESAKGDK
ncbi:hypothetical protein HDV03_003626 [Kappamyces sp. JEL0829]|nr:hypothetical protein HDV03_003626 [Kappamyces sp. JEL0829]